MRFTFPAFGAAHLAIVAMVPVMAAGLALVQRKLLGGTRVLRFGLAGLLLLCTVAYYGSFAAQGERMFPGHVPLELCDLSLWLTIVALITLKPAIFDVAYYWAIVGAGMALLTPNLGRTTTFLTVQYFADHGLIVVATVYLLWTGQARPRPGSVVRAMLWLHAAAVAVGAFDFVFNTDYMFLRAKPPTASLLDYFGPWPWYLAACEVAGWGLFWLLYLPYRLPRLEACKPADEGEDNQVEVPTSP